MSILFSGSAVNILLLFRYTVRGKALLLLFWADVCVLVLILLDCWFISSPEPKAHW